MRFSGTRFHHPVAFWSGTLAIAAGVCAHLPMFFAAREMHYRMAGMPIDAAMVAGMALILAGLAVIVWPAGKIR